VAATTRIEKYCEPPLAHGTAKAAPAHLHPARRRGGVPRRHRPPAISPERFSRWTAELTVPIPTSAFPTF